MIHVRLIVKAASVTVLGLLATSTEVQATDLVDTMVCSTYCGAPQPDWGRNFCAERGFSVGGMCGEATGPFNPCAGDGYEVACRN